jgi:hypothetical protein
MKERAAGNLGHTFIFCSETYTVLASINTSSKNDIKAPRQSA